MRYSPLLIATILASNLMLGQASAQIMIDQEQPIIHSKTVLKILPKGTVPKAITAAQDDSVAPELQNPSKTAPVEPPENQIDAEKPLESEPVRPSGNPSTETIKSLTPLAEIEVQVRQKQLPLDNGMYIKYKMDESHGLLTYFKQAEPRTLAPENIYDPVDILFIRDDGVIAQIMPNVMPAYMANEVIVEFPVRAYLYVGTGVSEAYGIKPGDRIEHKMFIPTPILQGQ